MGIIDPMAINSAAATGVIDFPGGAAIWLLLVGLLSGGFGALLFAAAQGWRMSRRGLPRLAAAPVGAALAGRVR
jgi:hypothetical protein